MPHRPTFEESPASEEIRGQYRIEPSKVRSPRQRFVGAGGNIDALESQRLSYTRRDPSFRALWEIGPDDRRSLYSTYAWPEDTWDTIDTNMRNIFEPRGGATVGTVSRQVGGFVKDVGSGILYAGSENLPRTGVFRDIPRFEAAPPPSSTGGLLGAIGGTVAVPPPVSAETASDLDIILGAFTFLPPAAQGLRGARVPTAGRAAGATTRTARPVVRGAAGGIRVPRLPNFDDAVSVATHQDNYRAFGNVNTFTKAIAAKFSGKNTIAVDPLPRGLTGRRALYAEGDMRTAAVMKQLSSNGTFKHLFPDVDETTSLFTRGPLKGRNVNDVARELPKHLDDLTPDQVRWIREDGEIFAQTKQLLEDVGLKIDDVDMGEGGIFLSREVAGRFDAQGNLMDAYAVPRRVKGGTRKVGSEYTRKFKTQEEGLKRGYRYLSQEETTALRLRQTYRRVADIEFRDYVLRNTDWVNAKVDGAFLVAQAAARSRVRSVDSFERAIAEALRGGNPSPSAVRAAVKAFPEASANLKGNAKVTIDDLLRSAEEGGDIVTVPGPVGRNLEPPRGLVPKDPVAFPVPKPGQLRKLEKQLAEAIERSNADPKNQALLKREIDLRRRLAFAKQRVARALKGEPPIVKEFRPSKALVAARRDTLNEMLDAILGERTVVRAGGRPRTVRKGGGLKDKAKREQVRAEKKVKQQKLRIVQAKGQKTGTADIPAGLVQGEDIANLSRARINLFEGKLFTGEDGIRLAGQAGDYVKELASRGPIRDTFQGMNALNSVPRMLVLAGDLSTGLIQLMGMAFMQPINWSKSMGYAVRAMFDPQVFGRFLREHQDTIADSRALILAHHSSEFTEAVRAGGILQRGPQKIIGKVLEPFQRAFDTSLDVAGVLMRESLVKPGMTAKEIADTERFINLFRGLTDTQRIGIGSLQQQLETMAFLAPRYRRATLSLYADIAKGGRSGALAREGLLKLALGTMFTFTAIDFSIAMGRAVRDGEDLGETSRIWWDDYLDTKLDPTTPGFLVTELLGQMIGPGPKLVSDGKKFVQVILEPDRAAEHAARWYRGQSSPVVRTVWDLAMGENIIGEATTDSPGNFLENIVAPNTMFIWAQSVAFEGGSLEQRALRGAQEFVGGRARPRTMMETLDFYVELAVIDARGNPVEQTSEDRVRRWGDLEPAAKGEIGATEDIRAIREHFSRDSSQERVMAARDKALDEQMRRDTRLVIDPSFRPKKWIDAYYNAQAESRGRSDIIETLRLFRDRDDLSDDEEAMQGYYDLLEKFEKEDGTYDYGPAREAGDRYLAGLPFSERGFVERNIRPNATETVRDFQETRRLRDLSGWYDTHKTASIYRQLPAVASLYDSYLEERRQGPALALEWLKDNPNALGLVRIMDKWEELSRRLIREGDPALDASLSYWYNYTPASDEASAKAAAKDSPEFQLHYMTAGGSKLGDNLLVVLQKYGVDSFEELAEVSNEQLRAWAIGDGVAVGGVRNVSLRKLAEWDIRGRAAAIAAMYEENRYGG